VPELSYREPDPQAVQSERAQASASGSRRFWFKGPPERPGAETRSERLHRAKTAANLRSRRRLERTRNPRSVNTLTAERTQSGRAGHLSRVRGTSTEHAEPPRRHARMRWKGRTAACRIRCSTRRAQCCCRPTTASPVSKTRAPGPGRTTRTAPRARSAYPDASSATRAHREGLTRGERAPAVATSTD
jgi:hypothetical protein